jgi:hypothetical protein
LHRECSLRFREWSQVDGLRVEAFGTA